MTNLDVDINDVVQNRPLFTICVSVILILFCMNFILEDATDKIGLVTANTLITNTYVWNLITSCFYERYIGKVLFDIIALLYVSKSLPIPSIEQFGLYFLFTILACTIGTSTYCFFSFMALAKETILITPIYGFSGILMCILMYARYQYRGESVHTIFPKITFHHLPIIFILFQVILYFLWCKYLVIDLPFSIISLLFSWSYLRFYYKHESTTEELGDKTEDFSFVTMFPEALHIVIVPFTTAFYNVIALIGLFPALEIVEKKPYHHLRHNSGSALAQSGGVDSPTHADKDNNSGAAGNKVVDIVADRRRAKALKLLDAKMAELAQEPEGWDDVGAMGDLESLIKPSGELSKYKV